MALLMADDEALLDFGLNFLKHVLFGEKFIEEYPDAYEKRLARKRERAAAAQQAAFDAKMALEDDKYSSDHKCVRSDAESGVWQRARGQLE